MATNQPADMDVASLVLETTGFLKNRTQNVPDSSKMGTRINPRQFFQNGGQHNGYPQHNQQYPQQQQPQFIPPVYETRGQSEYGDVVQAIPLNQIPAIPLPVDANGNPIIPDGYRINQPIQQPQQTGLQVNGFEVPNFGSSNISSTLSDEKFDNLMKEFKSLKKSVNKLIRMIEGGKLHTSKDEQPDSTIENNTTL